MIPSISANNDPTISPIKNPSVNPSINPTRLPSSDPSNSPSNDPTIFPQFYQLLNSVIGTTLVSNSKIQSEPIQNQPKGSKNEGKTPLQIHMSVQYTVKWWRIFFVIA